MQPSFIDYRIMNVVIETAENVTCSRGVIAVSGNQVSGLPSSFDQIPEATVFSPNNSVERCLSTVPLRATFPVPSVKFPKRSCLPGAKVAPSLPDKSERAPSFAPDS